MTKRSHYLSGQSDQFSGSIREFVELMTHQDLPFMTKDGRWIMGQTLYLQTTPKGKVKFSNTPY